ncbi:MAG: hypothetical protein IKI41_01905 [Clostridia bacterium]|nr:hypothetical protein [Clostridia bacterium]
MSTSEIISTVLSVTALLVSFFVFFRDQIALRDQAYDRFSQLWIELDSMFIQYPTLHKYFYRDNNGEYEKDTSGLKEEDKARLICIAERFADVFQYTFPMEKYIKRKDRKSYFAYKKMINESTAMKIANNILRW